MRQLYKVLITSMLFFNSISCLSQTKNNLLCSLKVDTLFKEKVRGEVYWVIFCSIQNHSETKMEYWRMSCSWTDFFQAANPEFLIDGMECSQENSPTIMEIDPKGVRKIALWLYRKSSVGNTNKKTKIGFRYINAKKSLNLNEMINDDNLVWSKQIILK